jgi:alkaline phosphatase
MRVEAEARKSRPLIYYSGKIEEEQMKRLWQKTGLVVIVLLSVMLAATVCPAGSGTNLSYDGPKAKYVFLIIGDGMAQPQRISTEMYLAAKEGKPHGTVKLAMSQLPAQGLFTTHAANSIIPDSADTATAMACGVKTNSGMVGMTPEGKAVKNVAELAKEKGMKVGIISTVSIDHATPAGFYAHQLSRNNYHEIAQDLVNSNFDFFGGGGIKDPEGKKAKEGTVKMNILDAAKKKGYKVVNNKEDFKNLTAKDGKAIVINEWLQDGSAMPYKMDRGDKDLNLAELVAKAAEMLEGPDGFFIMAEGGKVDWACHANDAVATINDMIDVDNAVVAALEFAKKHPEETLVIAAGDHETGGLTIGFAGTKYANYFEVLDGQKMSYVQFDDQVIAPYKKAKSGDYKLDDLKAAITEQFGLKFDGDPKDRMVLQPHEIADIEKAFLRSMTGEKEGSKDPVQYLLYGGYEPLTVTLTHLLNQKAGLAWTSYSHTGLPVMASAGGAGSELFNGYYDNTDIAAKLKAAMGLSTDVQMASK